MIALDVVQGTQEWLDARLGIPTASNFSRIVTAKTRKLSAASDKYLCELVAERIIGRPLDDASTDFMLRGSILEPDAAKAYEFENDCETVQIGFALADSRRWGASPDRLVGEDGLVEIKCPGAAGHVAALLGMSDDEHFAQVQGQLWVTGRKWCDLFFYNPAMPSHTVRIDRDDEYCAALDAAVPAFCDRVDEAYRRIVGDAAASWQARDGGSLAMAAGREGMDAAAVAYYAEGL